MSNYATPLTAEQRGERYARMNGQAHTLTPRQRRRIAHKRNHAAAPFGKRAAR